LDLLFQVISRMVGKSSGAAYVLSVWTGILTFLACILLAFLALRWSRNHLLWRLRNRLIVTYMFIGVIPVVLIVGIVLIAGYLFAGQFATFIAVEAIDSQVQALEHANTDVALDLASVLSAGAPFSSAALRKVNGLKHLGGLFEHTDLIASNGRKTVVLASWQPHSAEELYLPEWLTGDFSGVVVDNGRLSLRSAVKVPVKDDIITVIASAPVEGPLAAAIALKAGQIEIFPRTEEERPVQSSQPGENSTKLRKQVVRAQGTGKSIRAGSIPPSRGIWDREVYFLTSVKSVSWPTGPQPGDENFAPAAVLVGTRISTLYGHLFSNLGEYANYAIFILIAIAVVFGFIEFLALLIGVRLTRSMTRSVSNLYQATEHVNRGDLHYRIEVKSKDQLAALQLSFNSMSASIEKLLREQKEKERLQSELEIAQEVQAQLFPHTSKNIPGLEVHGVCRPARTVSGDYYDFLRLGDGKLGLAMGDISGKGISAALLMATIHSAVRVYELGRMPEREELVAAGAAALSFSSRAYSNTPIASDTVESPAAILSFLNRHLYNSTPAAKYATLFLGVYDGGSRTLTYANGGHLPPLLIAQDGSMRALTVGGTVIGLLENPTWEEQRVQMSREELLVAFSDGLSEPENEFGEFGEERLVQIIRENRHLPLERISELALAAVQDWIGNQEQPDDMTLVLARAR
ncbi:MAG TPA: SpoIIE family protein phosphatase, partial [Terriglobales bacterium]